MRRRVLSVRGDRCCGVLEGIVARRKMFFSGNQTVVRTKTWRNLCSSRTWRGRKKPRYVLLELGGPPNAP
jgi:hypothetical protein